MLLGVVCVSTKAEVVFRLTDPECTVEICNSFGVSGAFRPTCCCTAAGFSWRTSGTIFAP